MTVPVRFIFIFFVIAGLIDSELLKAQDLGGLKNEKPVSISGTLGGSMMFYDVQGKPPSGKPFTWMLTGAPTLTVYGIQFPFSFIVSEQQRDFRQPFNKFGVSPYYKWVKLHLGYRSINWSPYSMAGHSIFGVGMELNPGKFQFGILYGRLLKAIDPNSLTYDLNNSYVQTPTFERKALSMKFGYGSAKNNAGLIYLRGWDVPGSITGNKLITSLMPAENTIISFITHQQLGSMIHFDLQLSQSLYTNNINSTVPDSSSHGLMDIIPGSSFNATTYTSSAIETSLGYSGKMISLNVRFKQIDPGYRSMGAYFFQNDIRNITLEPAWHTGDQKYNLNASLGFQQDNLKKDLPSTTHRTIGSVSFTANPAQVYNINLTYSNYDLGQSKGMNPVDSLYEISQTTQNLAVNQNINLTGTSLSHNLMISFNFQKLKDKNSKTTDLNSYNSSTLMANYMISVLNIGLTASLGYNFTLFNLQNSENRISGPSGSLTKSIFKNKLSFSLADNYFKNGIKYTSGAEDRVSGINRISFMGTLRPSRHHRIYIRYYLNKGNAKTSNVIPFTENKGEFGYVYSF